MSENHFASVDAYVGSRVRMQRNILGMSQEKLAGRVGITFQQIQKYEKGTNRIGASRLYHLAKTLDVDISYFFEQYEETTAMFDEMNTDLNYMDADKEYKTVSQFLTSREGLSLIRAFSKIENPVIRRSFVELAKTLGKEEQTRVAGGMDIHSAEKHISE